MPVVHVATTLLGMIDAAIGGKTGVNLPEGKNLVGAFWQPHGVICDLDALGTLSQREVRCGYGEMAKYHFLTGDDLLSMSMTDRVARCVEIKAEIVASRRARGRPTSAAQLRAHAWPTRSRSPPSTGSPMAKRSPSGWCSPPSSPKCSGGSTPIGSQSTMRWWPASTASTPSSLPGSNPTA